jgi:hypothetical protein
VPGAECDPGAETSAACQFDFAVEVEVEVEIWFEFEQECQTGTLLM